MELVDIYDSQRRLTGRVHRRGTPLRKGDRILMVCVWVSDGAGRLLLTLRAPEKTASPNAWENSGGAALSGETSVQAIVRELREETGILAAPEEFTLLETTRTGDAFFDFYFLIHPMPVEQVILQPGETSDARWVTLPQMEGMIAEGLVAKPIARRFHIHKKLLEQLVWGKPLKQPLDRPETP